MIQKKCSLIILMLFCSLVASAQTITVTRPQKKQESTQQKTTTTAKPISKPTTTSNSGTVSSQETKPSTSYTPEVKTFSANGVSFQMVEVRGGTFRMGATSEQGSDAYDFEKPAHQVTLSNYYIGRTEVTQALWKAVMGSNPSHFKGDDLPVETVSWEDCQDFITRLNDMTGMAFRLPTEAEWEYAARGGNMSRGTKYSGAYILDNCGWYADNSGDKTHPVATKQPNELGIYDMSGNVYEWCSDWYGSYSGSSQTNPTGPSSGANRVLRGGCWADRARHCRSSDRYILIPGRRGQYYGLRLVLQ